MISKYAALSDAEKEELLTDCTISSWSYSKVSTFSRNEKAFEKAEIYREKGRRSASTIAGSAYHEALADFFKGDCKPSIIEMEAVAYQYIDDIPPNAWKLQKTAPSVLDCIEKATKMATFLISNFYREQKVYTHDMKRVLFVEERCEEWLTINGVDIPLPCHAYVDLVIEMNDGRIIGIDHKSRASFTDDAELSLTGGKQAITYVKCLEARRDNIRVDEFWFVENKYSTNKDGSSQLKKLAIKMDDETRHLYEAMLYEPLRRMIQAVSDPDYVYMINDTDNLCDRSEIYDFWAKTMIAEVDDFDIPEGKRGLIAKRLKKIRDASMATISPQIIKNFKNHASSFIAYDYQTMETNEKRIEHVYRQFGHIVQCSHEVRGYACNTYLLEVAAGVKVGSLTKYGLDIANALNIPSVRMGEKLVIYEGKAYFPIEVGKKREGNLIFEPAHMVGLKIPIGIDPYGEVIVWDLNNHSTPHMLVCGSTGSGKSVCLKATIEYALVGAINEIIILDPKNEFLSYKSNTRVEVINDIETIESKLEKLVDEMQQRVEVGGKHEKILIVFDEFADAIASSKKGVELDIKEHVVVGQYADKRIGGMLFHGKDKTELRVVGRKKSLEENLRILAQKGRSLGFHLVVATQRASTKVITGDAKVNYPVQICFRVPKAVDSKVVLDVQGAESLAGAGDGLMRSPEYDDLVRFQGYYYQ